MRGQQLVKIELETDAFKCDGCPHAEAVPAGTYALLRAPQSWLVVEYNGKAYTFHKPGCLINWARRLRDKLANEELNARRKAQGLPPVYWNEKDRPPEHDEATEPEPEPAH